MDESGHLGKRFSHVYLERGNPSNDSQRMRVRIATRFWNLRDKVDRNWGDLLHQELGVRLPSSYGGYNYSQFLEGCDLRDFLDFITLVWQELGRAQRGAYQTQWVRFANRVFEEENVGFRADDRGGIHYYVDEEFEHNRVSAIKSLQSPRYAAVLAEVNSSIVALDKTPPDGAAAIRCVFHALEITFKLLCEQIGKDGVPRLGSKEVGNFLIPALSEVYPSGSSALDAAKLLAGSFAKWVDSAHGYRHGQKSEEPSPPPLDLTIAMVSTGMSMLRWLAELDQQLRRK